MKRLLIVFEREMEVAIRDEPIVVLAVDEIMSLPACLVVCRIKKVTDTIGLFAYVVTVFLLDFIGRGGNGELDETYSCLVSSSMCCRAKLTG